LTPPGRVGDNPLMIDMTAVDREIRAARAELADPDNVKGILSLPTRKRIWRAMLDPADDELSYQHRIRLKIACVQHVHHLWYRAFPEDQRVEKMIALAQQLMNHQVDPVDAEDWADGLTNNIYCEVEDFNNITQPAVFVADASAHMVTSACYRDPDYDTVGRTVDDDELLPDSCASAAAGALNWQPLEQTDVPARRAFWTWYLDEAIPTTLAT